MLLFIVVLYLPSLQAGNWGEMDYGSTHVYMYESSDEEVISEGEYNEGMWLR